MKCEEFESVGWELGSAKNALGAGKSAELAAAREHANRCPRCAALQESWQEVRVALGALRAATAESQAPPRVEMRLRQQFRERYHAGKVRRTAMVAAWALATAALVVVAVSWWNWRSTQHTTPSVLSAGATRSGGETQRNPMESADDSDEPTLMADSDAGDFTLLPGSLAQETDDTAIVRVRLQRRALGALGLPVNEERAADWLQVDLLVGEDGQPRAVRLPSE